LGRRIASGGEPSKPHYAATRSRILGFRSPQPATCNRQPYMLHLGRFWFRNDEVVLLSGLPREIDALASTLEDAEERGIDALVVSDLAVVSSKHPAELVAVRVTTVSTLTEGVFHWPCLGSGTLKELRDIAHRKSEGYFPLDRPPGMLLVACHSVYNDQWWSVYG
jgi:hypothetical protein